ncbi:eCIS core domain-containing protein [Coleofasciculus chthonoplastes]|uniref:eCIS core domain-containing protein n=1 Tax=Coleofasciculus chthonoplastes TaxID=64178 RepID=UPI0032FE0F28
MGSRRRLNKKTSWESTSLPVPNPLQPRPFGKGIQARRAELPTTNVLQTRPFGTPKQASTPKQEMPELQAKLKQAESFGYNAANIPTVPSSNATPIQAKLTIGEPNDKYEQEADQVASQVVNQINSPQTQPSVQGKTVQREALPEEEEETPVSAKLESGTVQREALPEEEEEETPVSAKLESDTIQRQGISPEEEEKKKISPKLMRKSQSGTGSTNASVNLEESIQQKRGQGQSLSEDIREPMEQAFGADFSGVKVHTDSQSDQLNHSIQARAFTTGQDVFFKQGEYNPGSKDGQELLAHELTHVVQQTGTVQRDDDPAKKDKKKSKSTIEELRDALGGWGADSAQILQLLGKASASEKKQILTDSKLMGQLQSKLSRREMIQALNALEAPLKQKLNAAMKGWGCDAQVIKDLTASAKDTEKKAVLADTALVARLSSELSRAEMLVILGNLNAPIKDKLNAAMKGWGADAEAIKALTKGASDAEKQGILNDTALVARLSSELSRAEMLVILGNLNAPIKDKLNAAMKGWGADAEAIKTLTKGASDTDKQAVLNDAALVSRLSSELSGESYTTIILTLLAGVTDADFDTFIKSMTQSQTQALLNNISTSDQATYAALIERIKTARIIATGENMLGELQWRGGSGPDQSAGYQVNETTTWGHQNDFARWIRGNGPEPTPPNDTMNCWEGVLFMAYKAGVVNKSWLVDIHDAAAKAGQSAASIDAYNSVLESRLYSGARTEVLYDPGTGLRTGTIPAGNIIFINRLNHVVLSKGTTDGGGRHEVLSLWVLPNPGQPVGVWTGSEIGVLQDTTLEEVSQPGQKVEFAPPPW